MADPFEDFYGDAVDVQTLTGTDHAGTATFTPHPGVVGMMELSRTLVVGASGQEIQGAGTFWLPASVPAAWFTPGSKLTWRGRTYSVVGTAEQDADPDLAGTAVTIR